MTAHVLASRPADTVALRVETTPLTEPAQLVPLLEPTRPLLWMRAGDGIAGIGEALRLEFRGPDRIRDAANAWKRVTERASVTDPVDAPGSGLVAFGAFSFAASSAAASVLVVPSIVIGRRGDRAWITRISRRDVGGRPVDSPPVAAADAARETDAAVATAHGARRTSGGWRNLAGEALRAMRGEQRSDVTPAECPRPTPLGAEYRIGLHPGAMSPEHYTDAVRGAVARIRGGELAKVVLARDLVGHLPVGADLRRALGEFALGYPRCWTYAVDGLLGTSPETLITVSEGRLTARVLAGTASRGADATADHASSLDLETNAKDNQEHSYAVQSVLRTLQSHSTDLASSAVPFTLKLPNLWHLATDVTGTLADGSGVLDLVAALHPTAAVAGTPTPAAVAAIEELEPFDRGRYAGPVGWVDAHGDGEWAIALRGAQLGPDGDITAFAGCGIVAGSDPEAELAESTMKLRPVVETFG